MGGTPFDEQVPLQSIGRLVDGVRAEAIVSSTKTTNKTCSSSSLILHSVCASRLTGGNAYLRRPRGPAVCQCIRAEHCLG